MEYELPFLRQLAATPISPDLDQNLQRIRTYAGNTSELLINSIEVSGVRVALLFCEGMISTHTVTDLILLPLTRLDLGQIDAEGLFSHIQNRMMLSTDRPELQNYADLFRTLNSGFGILIADGVGRALAFGAQGFDRRSVSEPFGEANVTGAHDGFTETIRTNMSLVRRRMKLPLLTLQLSQLGEESQTDICLCWMRDRVPQALLDEIRKALSAIRLETLLSEGYLQPFLEQKRPQLFHSVGKTERPDVFCAKLLEGRVGILIDGTPFALTVPKLFSENFQTLDDYGCKPFYATFLRWMKYLAFLLAVLLPGLYVAVAVHHPELLNNTLLMLLAEAEQNAPFSLAAEAVSVLLMYEIVREAGLRLPKVVGGAVSIVGGLIIGDAAVQSGLISTPLLTVSALAVIAGFVVPDLNQPVTVLRLLFVLCGGFWGLFGISLLSMAVLFQLCAAEDFGYPVTAPVSPLFPRRLRDVLTRVSMRKLQRGNFTIEELHESDEPADPSP